MVGVDGNVIDKRTMVLANKARDIVNASIRELTQWTGNKPSVVRVKHKYFLVLIEVEWINSWPGIEIRPALPRDN